MKLSDYLTENHEKGVDNSDLIKISDVEMITDEEKC